MSQWVDLLTCANPFNPCVLTVTVTGWVRRGAPRSFMNSMETKIMKIVFLHPLCLIGLMITFQDVAGVDLSVSYPNTVGGACLNEVATATCTVISANLQWRVSDDQSGTEYFTFLLSANEDRIGQNLISRSNVTVFQNNTIGNVTDATQSLITSELRLLLYSSQPSVTITCSDTIIEERVQARVLENPSPTKLSQLGVVTRGDRATVYFIWEPPPSFARSDIVEYILTAIAAVDAQNQSSNTTVTGGSLELSTSMNYQITVQQRTKCMDISDPAMMLFEAIRDPVSTVTTVGPMPVETTAFEPNSKSDCSSTIGLKVGIGVLAVILIICFASLCIVIMAFLKSNKGRLTSKRSPKRPAQEVGPGEEEGEMVSYKQRITESKSVAYD